MSQPNACLAQANARRRTRLATGLINSDDADERDLAPELVLAHAAGKCGIDPALDPALLDPVAGELLMIVRALAG